MEKIEQEKEGEEGARMEYDRKSTYLFSLFSTPIKTGYRIISIINYSLEKISVLFTTRH